MGRFIFMQGYLISPRKRVLGFMILTLALLASVSTGIYCSLAAAGGVNGILSIAKEIVSGNIIV